MRTVSDPEGVSRNKVPWLTLPPPRVRPKKSPLGAWIRLVGALPSVQLGWEQNAYKVEMAPPGVSLKTVPGPASPPVVPYRLPGASMWKPVRQPEGQAVLPPCCVVPYSVRSLAWIRLLGDAPSAPVN